MITIITGPINSGKTTRMINLYHKIGQGDGFVMPKIYRNGIYAGQKIMRLSTKEETEFSFIEGCIPDWDEAFHYHNYSFSKKGFDFATGICRELISCETNPIYIDEVGPLELNKKGFFSIMHTLIRNDFDVYMTMRSNCLYELINIFNIKSYKIDL